MWQPHEAMDSSRSPHLPPSTIHINPSKKNHDKISTAELPHGVRELIA